jgi:hypothetical protein
MGSGERKSGIIAWSTNMNKFEYKFALNAGQSIDEPDDFVEEEVEEELNKLGC